MAMRAGLLNTEKALSHLYGAAAATSATGLGAGAGFGARAMTGVAFVPAGDANLRVFALRCFFEADLHRVAQVIAAIDLSARAATGLAKNIAKNITESVGKIAKALTAAGRAAHIGVNTRMAELIIGCTLFGVGQHLVGFFGLFEFDLSLRSSFTLIAIRVIFHGQFAISFFDLIFTGVLGNAQDLVVIALAGHAGP